MAASFLETIHYLGFDSYQQYLESDHWKEFRRKFKLSQNGQSCAVCGGMPVQPHHITYCRLGCELLDDVVALCPSHHEAVHKWLKDHAMDISKTRKAINALMTPQYKKSVEENKPMSIRQKRRASKLAQKKQRWKEEEAAALETARSKTKNMTVAELELSIKDHLQNHEKREAEKKRLERISQLARERIHG